MKGKPVEFGEFVVYPEYCDLQLKDLERLSLDGKTHVAALEAGGYNVGVVFRDGLWKLARPKYRLHDSEKRNGIIEGLSPPRTVLLDELRVLILICYELAFPEDYWLRGTDWIETDLVIHMVGTPMHSEEQREGWVALQRALSLSYGCPLVCCCGGRQGRMNISGVIEGGSWTR